MPKTIGSRRAGRATALRLARLVLLALWFPGCSASPGSHSEREVGSAEEDPNNCSIDLHLDVLEGEELVHDVRCPSAERGREQIEIESLPSGATFDARSSQLRWTPALDQAGSYVIEVQMQGARDAGRITIDVIDNFGAPENVPPTDATQYLREYGLPVVHVTLSPEVNDDTQQPATIFYQGHTFSGAFAKYRGATSRKYPKRSYTLKFDKSDPFIDRARGFDGAERVVLTTTFDDNSYLRQRLAYALWNRASASHLPIHAFNAVVFIDGQYKGLYVLSDHIDDDFLDDAGVFGHANLYKARKHDANFRLSSPDGDPKPNLHAGYTKEEGFPEASEPDAFADLDALVQWIATAPDDEFARDFDQRMVQSEFEDWLMFVCLIQATDSAGKNSYLYHDPRESAPEPRWRYLPWDFNASFGQGYRTQRRLSSEYLLPEFSQYNELFARMLRDAELRVSLESRFREALNSAWARTEVLTLFDEWTREIGSSALRDEQKWGAAYRDNWGSRTDLTSYLEEISYVRAWIDERWGFMHANL
jgi:spore coat protein H